MDKTNRRINTKNWKTWVIIGAVAVILIAVIIDFAEPRHGLITKPVASTTSAAEEKETILDGTNYTVDQIRLGPAGSGKYYTYDRKTGDRVSYTGIVSNNYGTWYVKDGSVDFGYTGSFYNPHDGLTYYIVNGQYVG